jgi:hypothetical protein
MRGSSVGLLRLAALLLPACQAHSLTAAGEGSAGASRAASTSRSSAPQPATGASSDEPIDVPGVHGKTRSDAEATLRAAGVRGAFLIETDGGRPVDFAVATVCSQSPGGGGRTLPDRSVTLTYCQAEARSVEHGTTLVGYSIEEAIERARAAGFTGKISVAPLHEFDRTCKAATVCSVSPARWELTSEHWLTLYVNRKVTIRTPN